MCFPKWCYDGKYLPTISELKSLPRQWNCSQDDFIYHNPLWTPFQVINEEFISSLSEKISSVINDLPEANISILEIGAWNGRLSYFLKKNLVIENTKKNIFQIAIDDFSWIKREDPYIWMRRIKWIKVKESNVKEAIKKYKPNIVISSWMPHHEDWTKVLRGKKSVKAFILIWNPEQCWTEESWKECNNFEWKKVEVDWNICWEDSITYNRNTRSKVVIFKRKD